MLGSGNLGLIYLMDEPRRLTLEEIEERHPRLLPALREHPHVGWLLVRSAEHGPVVARRRRRALPRRRTGRGRGPARALLADRAPPSRRTDGFEHVADIMVGSFYDPELDEGCAFEELISFHGGLGGLQTRPFILYPVEFPVPDEPIIGAAACTGCSRAGGSTSRGNRRRAPSPDVGALRHGRVRPLTWLGRTSSS